ncbi:MAG: hypothetical protein WBL95_08535 [Microcoleus sp.]
MGHSSVTSINRIYSLGGSQESEVRRQVPDPMPYALCPMPYALHLNTSSEFIIGGAKRREFTGHNLTSFPVASEQSSQGKFMKCA